MSAQAFDHSEHVVPMNRLSSHSDIAGGEVLRQAHDTVETCPCKDGCDKCKSVSKDSFSLLIIFTGIHSATCSEGNVVASKMGALLILKALLNLDIDADSVVTQFGSQGSETIVEATYIRPLDGVQVEPA